ARGSLSVQPMAVSFIVQAMRRCTPWVEARSRFHPVRWIAVGLLLALATGLGAWLVAHPFLTSHTRYLDLPVLGPVPLASAMFFDLGVFALVVGATALILIALAHQSIRSHRLPRPPQPPEED